jgi:hypothetical protein
LILFALIQHSSPGGSCVTVAIEQTFFSSCNRLNMTDKGRTFDFMRKFQENPANPGCSLERVESNKARDLWTARISQSLRAVIYHRGDTHVLLYAGHHDEAIRWAERRKTDRHAITGELQIIELPESYIEQVTKFPVTASAPKLFAAHSDDYLRSIGAAEELLPLIRLIESEDQLLEVTGHLPDDLADNLLTLADGQLVVPPTKPATIPAEPLITANQRFWVVGDAEDLAEVLNQPFEAWLRYLHPSQRQLVQGVFSGPVKVTGAAGTGKTVVAMHRAKELARTGKKVLLTTHVTTLSRNIDRNLDKLLTAPERKRVTVSTVASAAMSVVRQVKPDLKLADDTEVEKLVERFAHHSGLTVPFLKTEWRTVIQRQGITEWEEYRQAPRTGRGVPIGSKQREAIWKTFGRVFEQLEASGTHPWLLVYRWAEQMLTVGRVSSPYDAVIVDEAQDCDTIAVRFLAALSGASRSNLMMVGDVGQQIYPGGYSLQKLGIDVRGRSKVLRINYRTTRQIQRAAERLRAAIDEDTSEKSSARSLLNGPEPSFRQFATTGDHDAFVEEEIRRLLSEGLAPNEIAVFARNNDPVRRLAERLTSHGIATTILSKETDVGAAEGILLGTMHRAKGLEFKSVFAAYCSASVLPSPKAVQSAADDAERREILDLERQLLYVTLTRARDNATVAWVGQPSPYVEQIRAGAG